jgi:uncharacterized short protein YbdD (DUF466 family)
MPIDLDSARLPGGWRRCGGLWLRARARWRAGLTGLRRVAGMPDYAEYLRHLAARHPEWPVPSEREFFDLYLRSRYGDGPTRCC